MKEISKRYSDISLALLHVGGASIVGILSTMDAKEGLEMFNLIIQIRSLFLCSTMTTMY